jgi:hypothetical protein
MFENSRKMQRELVRRQRIQHIQIERTVHELSGGGA